MSSASLDAWLRASNTNQPKTRVMIRYSRRTDTACVLPQLDRPPKLQVNTTATNSEAVQSFLNTTTRS
jgi:hypothetical protein